MGDGAKLPGRWVYGGVLQGIGSHSIIYGGENADDPDDNFAKWCVHTDTLGQFTGLTDKNGKKIFEGDIVRHHNGNPYAINSIVEKGVVYWDDVTCGWRRTSNGAFHHGVVDTYRMSHECVYEVIGNIHDNPELLDGEKEN
jgi:uncharacterized phage protein (TIGR01671 family)